MAILASFKHLVSRLTQSDRIHITVGISLEVGSLVRNREHPVLLPFNPPYLKSQLGIDT
jgi:hypothetical protein